jgi:uncharacterized membrane protein YeaQ/YmgE (transglycosylase-associated protein family)
MTGHRVRNLVTDKGAGTGVITWAIPGLIASALIPGRRSQGPPITCVPGIAGAAIRLPACDLVTGRRGRRGHR